ncbi:dynein heavy chain, cytoplasmic-like [Lycorma delicatula]|uniref:dynein heavy chain, cytoplasmic-like n=1 Tax=Lycorma delicatula TaxID=130591 RepID=UPI003F50DB83
MNGLSVFQIRVGSEFTNKLDLDGPPNWKAPDFFPAAYVGLPSTPTHRDAVINACIYDDQTLHKANARLPKRDGRTMAITPRFTIKN